MAVLDAYLAVGGPNLVSGQGWDVAPLVLVGALLLLMRWARIPLHAPAVCSAVAGGVLLDPLIDASGTSFPFALAVLTLTFGIVALRRTPAR
jgi:hypothetical protein